MTSPERVVSSPAYVGEQIQKEQYKEGEARSASYTASLRLHSCHLQLHRVSLSQSPGQAGQMLVEISMKATQFFKIYLSQAFLRLDREEITIQPAIDLY